MTKPRARRVLACKVKANDELELEGGRWAIVIESRQNFPGFYIFKVKQGSKEFETFPMKFDRVVRIVRRG